MDRWEYLIENINRSVVFSLEQRMNMLGADGWELVSLTPILLGKGGVSIPVESTTENFMAVYKRPQHEREHKEARFG